MASTTQNVPEQPTQPSLQPEELPIHCVDLLSPSVVSSTLLEDAMILSSKPQLDTLRGFKTCLRSSLFLQISLEKSRTLLMV